MLKLFCN